MVQCIYKVMQIEVIGMDVTNYEQQFGRLTDNDKFKYRRLPKIKVTIMG